MNWMTVSDNLQLQTVSEMLSQQLRVQKSHLSFSVRVPIGEGIQEHFFQWDMGLPPGPWMSRLKFIMKYKFKVIELSG